MYNNNLKWRVLIALKEWKLNNNQIAKKYKISWTTVNRWYNEIVTDLEDIIDKNTNNNSTNTILLWVLFWVIISSLIILITR